jgi:hypothetical protein
VSVPLEWLQRINQEFRDTGLEQRKRPWEALRRYALEFKVSIGVSSTTAKEIFKWFKEQSKPGVHQIESLFQTIYYFDTEFWTVSIPVFFGTVRIIALDCLREMPQSVKKNLMSNAESAWNYTLYWADCFDYATGINEVVKSSELDVFGLQLLRAGDRELRSAIAQLKERRPDPRVILTCRMATELFLKAYIALKSGLSQKQAKALGHDLEKAFDKFVEVSGYAFLASLKSNLTVYPPIHARYDKQDMSLGSVWKGFQLAQSIGTITVREHTCRNTLGQILAGNIWPSE